MIDSAGLGKTTLSCVLRWLLISGSPGHGKSTLCCVLRWLLMI